MLCFLQGGSLSSLKFPDIKLDKKGTTVRVLNATSC